MPKITFYSPDKTRKTVVDAEIGKSILDIAQENDLPMEGTCEGEMACSTCHVILSPAEISRVPAASEEELDMLDFAYGLTPTSRLGCQIRVTGEMEGMEFILPGETLDMTQS